MELGIVIERPGKDISESCAMEHIGGYVLALDMTARDVQDEAKKKGHPWTLAKGFDTSCPVSCFIPCDKVPDPQNINLWLKVSLVQLCVYIIYVHLSVCLWMCVCYCVCVLVCLGVCSVWGGGGVCMFCG